mmetsp:Transcript_10552/g.41183  ORF Transcript_10552/g.41183 Transcript_10552/m.41183 type:complete len:203 (-) Transcript_10552:69-677(-)
MRVAALLRDALGEIRFPEVSGHAVQRAEFPAAALVEDHVHELGGERAEISEVVIRRSALLNHATALGLDRGAIPRHLHDGPLVNLALPVRARRDLVNVGVVKVPHHAVRGVDADCVVILGLRHDRRSRRCHESALRLFHIDLRALGPYMAPDGRPGRGHFFLRHLVPQTEPLSLSSLRASSDPRDLCFLLTPNASRASCASP